MTSTFRATRVSGSFTSRRLSSDELSLNRTDWAEAGPDSAIVSALRVLAISGIEVVAADPDSAAEGRQRWRQYKAAGHGIVHVNTAAQP